MSNKEIETLTKKMITILYAEDEEDIRSIAQIALEDIGGFDVKYAFNGLDVLEIANDFTPDLMLLDVMMPHMDGPTALRELRKRPRFTNVPTIFMTAKIEPNKIKEYKAIGAINVISKPFDPISLADTLLKSWREFHE